MNLNKIEKLKIHLPYNYFLQTHLFDFENYRYRPITADDFKQFIWTIVYTFNFLQLASCFPQLFYPTPTASSNHPPSFVSIIESFESATLTFWRTLLIVFDQNCFTIWEISYHNFGFLFLKFKFCFQD